MRWFARAVIDGELLSSPMRLSSMRPYARYFYRRLAGLDRVLIKLLFKVSEILPCPSSLMMLFGCPENTVSFPVCGVSPRKHARSGKASGITGSVEN